MGSTTVSSVTRSRLRHMGTETEHRHLHRAVELAAGNVREGGRPFGAVVVLDGEVLAEGVNTTVASSDPVAHAEAEAIRAACRARGALRLDGAVVYASGEPCVMCQAIGKAVGVEAMVFAASVTQAAAAGWPFTDESLRLHAAWTAAAGGYARQVQVPGAAEPIAAWAAAQS